MIVQSEAIRAEIDPAFGARVTSLVDRRTGRDWLVPGPAVEGGTYGAAEARGWDECFPTVAPCEHPAWGPLRDHGELWSRPWRADGDALTCETPRFRFSRRLTAEGDRLHADYAVDCDEPWMWSQHALLALHPGERFAFEGADPGPVGPVEEDTGLAEKTYAPAEGRVRAAVGSSRGGIALEWDAAEMPVLGLWRSYGGWPPGGPPAHQVAIEPTTHAADDLASAEAPRRGPARWRVTLHLTEETA